MLLLQCIVAFIVYPSKDIWQNSEGYRSNYLLNFWVPYGSPLG